MSHLRQQIREQVATTLTGLTTTGTDVFQSRIYPMEQANLPGLIIYTVSEATEPLAISGDVVRVRARMNMAIEAYAMGADIDDTFDTIAKEVQVAMAGDRSINSLAVDSLLTETSIDFVGDGEKPAGYITLNYVVEYDYDESNPEVALT